MTLHLIEQAQAAGARLRCICEEPDLDETPVSLEVLGEGDKVLWEMSADAEAGAAIGAVAFLALLWRQGRRDVVWPVLGALPPALALASINWMHFGAPWRTAYALTGESNLSWRYFVQNWSMYIESVLTSGVRLFAVLGVISLAYGIYLSLWGSPPDYQQSETVRIMYIHVPAAWLSLFIYASMALAALILLIWKHTLAGLYIRSSAPVGAAFTAICLLTGALWGQPSWGTWWVWDARLTSVLILFFLYLGVMALGSAFDDKDKSQRASAWLVLIGSVNLPVIKFSVEWWNTLHQPASLTSLSRMANPGIHPDMLVPLLVMAFAFLCLFAALAVLRLDNEILARKIHILRIRGAHG